MTVASSRAALAVAQRHCTQFDHVRNSINKTTKLKLTKELLVQQHRFLVGANFDRQSFETTKKQITPQSRKNYSFLNQTTNIPRGKVFLEVPDVGEEMRRVTAEFVDPRIRFARRAERRRVADLLPIRLERRDRARWRVALEQLDVDHGGRIGRAREALDRANLTVENRRDDAVRPRSLGASHLVVVDDHEWYFVLVAACMLKKLLLFYQTKHEKLTFAPKFE